MIANTGAAGGLKLTAHGSATLSGGEARTFSVPTSYFVIAGSNGTNIAARGQSGAGSGPQISLSDDGNTLTISTVVGTDVEYWAFG
jgi:hypothetical protein